MKNFYLTVFLFLTYLLNAQNNFCSLVPNGSFTSSNHLSSNPFRTGLVSGWDASHGTPIYNGTSGLNGTYSPEIEADYNTFTQHIGSGIRTQSKINFVVGKQYYIVYNYRNNNATPADLKFALVQNSVSGTTGNTLPLTGLTSYQISAISVGAGVTTWTRNTVCFIAPYNSADLWIYAQITPGGALSRIGIDEVEIYEDFNFAGTPKVRYTCDLPVTIGLTTGSCIPLNPVPTHNWYIIPSNVPAGTSQSITVSPSVDTKYVIQRNNGGCVTTDTIEVRVSHKPTFDLGNDTTLCQCSPINLGVNAPTGPCYTYSWNTGSNSRVLTLTGNDGLPVGTLSKTYTLTVTDNCTGCTFTDNIIVTYKPVPHCAGRSLVVCEAELPMSLVTKGIGTSYLWTRISGTGTPPSLPYTNSTLVINSIGRYVCTVTDANGPCITGYDTITVLPWDSIPLKIIANQSYSPCERKTIYLLNLYDPSLTTALKWYKDGVYIQTSVVYATSANGTYVAELISPNGLCIKRDTFKLVYIDPPIINLPPIYGSFCKNFCDTILKFTYCDTCGTDMGKIDTMKITWTGDGVTSRKVGSKNNFYFCAQKAKCGNNILTATIIYSKYGITCTTTVVTNAYKVCPLQLDTIGPFCSNDPDVYIFNQGLYITNAVIQGTGVYQETTTNKFKFSPSTAGPGLHKIRYYYDDGAGCFGWDSTYVQVYGKPRITLLASDCINGPATWNVLIYAGQAEGDTYYLSSSEWSGTSIYPIGYNANYLTKSFWGSTNGTPIPGHTYWFKVCNNHGCCDSAGLIIGIENPLHLTYDTTGCINSGVDISVTYNGVNMTGVNFPSNIAYSWDNEIKCNFLSATWGMDPNLPTLLSRISASPYFSSRVLNMTNTATKKVFTLGWHRIRILTLGGCEYEDSIYVSWRCGNCPIGEPQNIIITSSTAEWNHDTIIITGNLIIKPGAKLEIKNSVIIFAPCSKIVVESFDPPNMIAGILVVQNSTLQGCSSWMGIEVWGNKEIYDVNQIDIGLGKDPRTNLNIVNPGAYRMPYGWVYLKNSIVQDAEIGVFLGKRVNANTEYDYEFSGGLIFADSSTFSNNYIDITFTPRLSIEIPLGVSNGGSNRESWNASYIVRCTFNLNRAFSNCDTMSWYSLANTLNPIGVPLLNLNLGCHIIGLSETITRVPFIYPFVELKIWDYSSWSSLGNFDISGLQEKCTLKRDARIPFSIPHPLYDNPGGSKARRPLPAFPPISFPSAASISKNINLLSTNCNNW